MARGHPAGLIPFPFGSAHGHTSCAFFFSVFSFEKQLLGKTAKKERNEKQLFI
ncbi:hypothetical protein [Pedobacter sp. UBA4863]|uniref:hypothetical protein n=1 Tax=Pedobacter sp. UBA4863 TaxID=1947060 RepID=UPI00260007DC|nr:hypothetical protein [Pedobacter sp. UBA4863]